jgi:uncharacterized membrane-anchored protein
MTSLRLGAVLLAMAAASAAPAQNKDGKKGEQRGEQKGPPAIQDEKALRQHIEKETNAVQGPTTGKLTAPGKGGIAEIKVPAGASFIAQPGAAKFAQLTGNLGGDELGGVIFLPDDAFMVFFFDPIGYVKDDEKDSLDADKIMRDLTAGQEQSNKQRKAMGGSALFYDGWAEKPFFDPQTKNLTWAVKIKDEQGHVSINHRVKLLGREGVMNAILACSPEEYAKAKQGVNPLLAGYSYTAGNTYAEWKPGDKVAAYGLAGLIAGGAAFGAAKLGFLGWLGAMFAKGGKVIIIAVVAVVAGVWKLVTSLFGGRR